MVWIFSLIFLSTGFKHFGFFQPHPNLNSTEVWFKKMLKMGIVIFSCHEQHSHILVYCLQVLECSRRIFTMDHQWVSEKKKCMDNSIYKVRQTILRDNWADPHASTSQFLRGNLKIEVRQEVCKQFKNPPPFIPLLGNQVHPFEKL